MNADTGRPSRRQILKRAAGLTGATLLGSAVLSGAGTAAAAVATSKRFDLTDPSDEWFREILLQDTRILQSFSFDNTNKHLYTAQLVQEGRQLPGETRTYTGTERETNGDLCITRLDWQGYVIGRMYLRGFGHGVSIAAEPSGNSAYLWTETDSVPDSKNVGYGTKIARFKFANGAVLTPDSHLVTRFDPVPGSDHNTVAIDPVNSRLAHRHRVSGTWKLGLHDLATFKAGTFTPLATITQPAVLTGPTFQGYTSLGQYLYTLDGNAYTYDSTTGNRTSDNNTYVTTIDWNTGTVVERALTKAGESLFYREPEGLAIQIPDISNPAAARLHIGFGSEESLSQTDKKASFYYKDALI
ncbi:Tat pathway signal sequence domain protein [Streptomyces ipomoeae]|uniref:phage baseplate protein n=1 Tax=Streptomyces ipomoeae TaxID=103232 RepID=UPI0011468798|nr:Tat pathway signal sequence domain protein [Streptomyces ipomoeae]MDX2824320.1 Tat pathway signal sequence domain protein [Streptomyces ipomoeae]MDX2874970.1 Tat pathway signal sequence domain protein [Streptomyces ipomoeae]TQE30843.1 Tat pathway signal sequence domain protein [Streptomyces ipomoeae]